jgi:DNA-binding LacI/PurR family transcriptional regulator
VVMAQRASLDGLLINPAHITNDELLTAGLPAVILGTHMDFPSFDKVGVDIEGGARHAIRYLYELGHRRIAHIAPPHHLKSGLKRYRGYALGLAACGLRERADYIVETPYTRDGGYQAMGRLLALADRPTAVFASNDQQAIGALRCAIAQGVCIPDEMSIIGLDDIEASAVTSPPLTTLRRPQSEYGAAAMEFLLERIDGQGPDELHTRLFPCELIVRGSTAPPMSNM